MAKDIYSIVEQVNKSGKLDKGINETTKSVERGIAKLIVIAKDVEPKELTQHLPILCKEKSIKLQEVDSKQKLGVAVGINVSCSAVAVIDAGESKADIDALK